MGGYIQNLLLILFEVICCSIFFETFGKKRYSAKFYVGQIFVLWVMCFAVAYTFSQNFFVRQIAGVLTYGIIMFWCISISIQKSIILSVFYIGILGVIDYVAYAVNNACYSKNILSEEYKEAESMMIILLSKSIVFLCVLLIRRRFGKRITNRLKSADWVKLLFIPTFTIIIIASVLVLFDSATLEKQTNILFVIAFGMIGMNVFVFLLVNDIVKREESIYENNLFRLQVENQAEMYRSVSENFEVQRKRTHEYKNQIICIESLLEKQEYGKLNEYVKTIFGKLELELDAINTNNIIVNAILNTKYQEAVRKGIVFVFKVNDLSAIGISDDDVVTLLSNLLNNAIEACEKCTTKKRIKLKFVNENGKVILSVKNTYCQPVTYENGTIISTKQSEYEEHGVGIKNIIKIVEKYGGSYVIKHDKEEFNFSIMI